MDHRKIVVKGSESDVIAELCSLIQKKAKVSNLQLIGEIKDQFFIVVIIEYYIESICWPLH